MYIPTRITSRCLLSALRAARRSSEDPDRCQPAASCDAHCVARTCITEALFAIGAGGRSSGDGLL
jgi:hypothetical protein